MSNQIVTLDGKFWNEDAILKQMDNDEFYYGYLGKNALSSSSCKLLNKSPKAYQRSLMFGSKRTSAMTAGWLLHLAIFELDKFKHLNFIEASTRNTKVYKEAFAENPMTFLRKEYEDTMRLADAIYSNSTASSLIEGMEYEKPAVGNLFGMPFRAKADSIGTNGRLSNGIVDLKTTTGLAENSFPYNAKKYSYQSQVYIYCNLFGIDYKDFIFLCIDKETKDIGVYEVSDSFYYDGERLVESAVNTYNKYFLDSNENTCDEYTITGVL
jgi:hypothetical protein